MGRAASVLVDQNGERIEYGKADIGKLRAWIAELEGLCGVARRVTGPMRILM